MWKDLTMSQRAEVIQMAVKSGMRDLNQIRSFYDESVGSRRFDEGGRFKEEDRFATTQMPELVVSAKRKYIAGYDENGEKGGDILGIPVPSWAETTASFVPILGTAMDIKEAINNPTAANIGSAGLSLLADLGGAALVKAGLKGLNYGSKIRKAEKAVRKAVKTAGKTEDFTRLNKAQDRLRAIKKEADAAGYEPAQEIPEYFLKSFPVIADVGVNASQHGLPGEYKALGGPIVEATHSYQTGGGLRKKAGYKAGDKAGTDQCAAWSNGVLRANNYGVYGNAWNLTGVNPVFNGYEGLRRPSTYNKDSVEMYNHAATSNVFKNFDSKTLDKSRPYVVNMFYNGSPHQETAYNEGTGVAGTHTGLLTWEGDDKNGQWVVTHNIHDKIHQEPFLSLQSKQNKYGVTAISSPKKSLGLAIKNFFGY